MLNYTWLVLLFPALGVLINIFLGRRMGKTLVGCLSSGFVGLSFLAGLCILSKLTALPADERVVHPAFFTWIASGDFVISAGFLIDPLSCVMMLVVSGVGFLIHVYSIGYMHKEEGFARYFAYLNLFTFFMLLLVLADNFLLLFVGWEGVGLCSYLLIGFWFEKKSAADAGKKAFIVNRIGDFGFALGVMLIFVTFGTLDYQYVFANAEKLLPHGGVVATMITLLLFVGATGKSAQIPLYVWLPDAMEGPTPVSALIHAATMVTAGVYLVARSNVLYLLAPVSMLTVAIVGAVTAIYAASIGLVQNDIKRVLAYSTISQLGYMFLACGVGAFSAGIFHLMTHAFFKALLFLGAGSVIHALSGEQDIRNMGGLRKHIPYTYWTFLAASLAISGIIPFSGYFSKDAILARAFEHGSIILWAIGVLTAVMTAFYIFRLFFLTFHGNTRLDEKARHHIHESPKVMIVPLILLAVLSVAGGWLGISFLKQIDVFGRFLSPVFSAMETGAEETHLLKELPLIIFSSFLGPIGIAAAYYLYIKNPQLPVKLAGACRKCYSALLNKFYIDEAYQAVFINPAYHGANFMWKELDVKLVDGAVNGMAKLTRGAGRIARRWQSGFSRHYAMTLVLGLALLLICYFRSAIPYVMDIILNR